MSDENSSKRKKKTKEARDRRRATIASQGETDAVVTSYDVRTHVSHNERWEDSFQRLKMYRKKFGHCDVPFRYAEDSKLGRWVAFQRSMYRRMREGKTDNISLTQERIRRLEKIGFEWSLKGKIDTSWDARYQELVAFANEFKHCHVPVGWEQNPQLAEWVVTQREQGRRFNEGRGGAQINQEQIAKLTAIGFVWNEQSSSTSESSSSSSHRAAARRTSDFARATFSGDDSLSTHAGLRAGTTSSSASASALGGVSLPLSLGGPFNNVHPLRRQHEAAAHFLAANSNFQMMMPGLHVLQPFESPLNVVNPYQNAAFAATTARYPAQNMRLEGSPFTVIGSLMNLYPSSSLMTARLPEPVVYPSPDTNFALNVAQRLQVIPSAQLMLQGNNATTTATASLMAPTASHAIPNALLGAIAPPPLPSADSSQRRRLEIGRLHKRETSRSPSRKRSRGDDRVIGDADGCCSGGGDADDDDYDDGGCDDDYH